MLLGEIIEGKNRYCSLERDTGMDKGIPGSRRLWLANSIYKPATISLFADPVIGRRPLALEGTPQERGNPPPASPTLSFTLNSSRYYYCSRLSHHNCHYR